MCPLYVVITCVIFVWGVIKCNATMHGDNWLATCANYSQLVSTTGNRSSTMCRSLSRALRGQIRHGGGD